MAPAYTVAFSADGTELLTGFKDMVRVFDVDRPGRWCQQRSTITGEPQLAGLLGRTVTTDTPHHHSCIGHGTLPHAGVGWHAGRGKKQKGIISCIAVAPGDTSFYACGSYSKTVGYVSRTSLGSSDVSLSWRVIVSRAFTVPCCSVLFRVVSCKQALRQQHRRGVGSDEGPVRCYTTHVQRRQVSEV